MNIFFIFPTTCGRGATNTSYGSFFAGVYRRSHDDVARTIAAVALGPVLGKRVFALSKGYARRLIWALALLAPHPLLLMDEPFDASI